jgi:hypothetical protein
MPPRMNFKWQDVNRNRSQRGFLHIERVLGCLSATSVALFRQRRLKYVKFDSCHQNAQPENYPCRGRGIIPTTDPWLGGEPFRFRKCFVTGHGFSRAETHPKRIERSSTRRSRAQISHLISTVLHRWPPICEPIDTDPGLDRRFGIIRETI